MQHQQRKIRLCKVHRFGKTYTLTVYGPPAIYERPALKVDSPPFVYQEPVVVYHGEISGAIFCRELLRNIKWPGRVPVDSILGKIMDTPCRPSTELPDIHEAREFLESIAKQPVDPELAKYMNKIVEGAGEGLAGASVALAKRIEKIVGHPVGITMEKRFEIFTVTMTLPEVGAVTPSHQLFMATIFELEDLSYPEVINTCVRNALLAIGMQQPEEPA